MSKLVLDPPVKTERVDPPEPRSESDRFFYLRALAISAALAAVAYVGSYLIHPRYESSMSLYFPMVTESSNSPLADLKTGGGGDPGSVRLLGSQLTSPEVGSSKDTALAILNSNTCLKRVVQANDLTQVYGKKESKAIQTLKDRLAVQLDKNGLIEADVTDEDPQRAANILISLRSTLEQMSSSLTVNVSRSNRVFIEQQVADAQRKYERAEKAMAAALKDLPYSDATKVKTELASLVTRKEEAHLTAVGLRAQTSKSIKDVTEILKHSGDFAGQVVAVTALYGNQNKLPEDLEARELNVKDARTQYNRQSIPYQMAKSGNENASQIAKAILDLRNDLLKKGIDPSAMGTAATLNALQATEKVYDQRIAFLKKAAEKAPDQFIEMKSIERDYGEATQQLDLLDKELVNAKIAEIRDPSRFEVVDAPEPSDEIVYPKRGLTAGIVLFFAFAFQVFPRLFGSPSKVRTNVS